MDETATDRWAAIRAKYISTPQARAEYERSRDSIIAMRRLLQAIDSAREEAGLSKSDLARRIGASPATVRRLFTSPTANPTLKTVVDLFGALDLELELHHRGDRHVKQHPEPAIH
ncbi:MAG: helix-turn-helix transcriptional regulator [Chloroflexota bacterium]